MAPVPDAPAALDLETAARLLAERVEGLGLTPAERAEIVCLALGVSCEASAAARGVSRAAIRARRRRIRLKLAGLRPLRTEAPAAPARASAD